jgi:hypothetical protein
MPRARCICQTRHLDKSIRGRSELAIKHVCSRLSIVPLAVPFSFLSDYHQRLLSAMVRESCLIKLVEVSQGRPKTRVGAYHLGGIPVPTCWLSPPEAPLRSGVSAYRSVHSERPPEMRRNERPRVGSVCPNTIDASELSSFACDCESDRRGALTSPCSDT